MPSETLVMIPPLLCDARVFEVQLAALSRDHAVTVAPATCGERMEEIASQILSWAPSRFALFGMGMGGMVAIELLRRAPERVTRLMLVGTTAQADTPEIAAARETQIIAARAGRWEDVLNHEINAEWIAPTGDRAQLTARLTRMGQDIGAESYVRQIRALQRRKDQQAVLGKIGQPTQIICGRHDGQYNVKRHQFMAQMMPNAHLEVIENAGYMPTLETPADMTGFMKAWMAQPQ